MFFFAKIDGISHGISTPGRGGSQLRWSEVLGALLRLLPGWLRAPWDRGGGRGRDEAMRMEKGDLQIFQCICIYIYIHSHIS